MFKEINEETNLLLWDTHMVKIARNGNKCEIVVHPADTSGIVCRIAESPYCCTLVLEDGDRVDVDLFCEEHWGDIQKFLPDDGNKLVLGWGNDVDGHRKIVKVEDECGNDIPLDKFERDVNDFIIYFEG